MKTITKTDLEDLTLILEELVKRLPDMKREERIDVCARVRTLSKHLDAIDKIVKDEIKAKCKGKEGYVNGEIFKAKLSLVPVTRLDQKVFKEEQPKMYSLYAKDTEDQRISLRTEVNVMTTRMVDQKGKPVDVDLMEALKPKYPKIKVKLTGQDGNAFMLIGLVQRALRKAKVPDEQVAEFRNEAMSGDYNALLATCCRWVDVS